MFGVALTGRGRAVVGLCLLGAAIAGLWGTRSLNAVVLPGLIALVAAVVQLDRLDAPSVQRELPPDDVVGATHDVTLRFSDPETPGETLEGGFVADVRERLDEGLSRPADAATTADDATDVTYRSAGLGRGSVARVRATVGTEDVTYGVTFDRRGEHELGPVTLTATDVFGLCKRELTCSGADTVLVYPSQHQVPGWIRRALYHDEALGVSRQRDEFDRLREYAPGDSLRDVHWPTTAKRDELVVKEFAAETVERRVTISGGGRGRTVDESASGKTADALATAVASVAVALLEDGVPVEVSVPNGRIAVRSGPEGRRRLLEHLARTPLGAVPDPDADVVVKSGRRETTVELDDRCVTFETLRADAARSSGGERGSESARAENATGGSATAAVRSRVDGGRPSTPASPSEEVR